MNLVERAGSGSSSGDAASSLEYQRIAPHAVELCDAFPFAEDSKAARGVKRDARFVLGKHRRLKHPSSVPLGCIDERFEKPSANSLPARRLGDIDADFADAAINMARRNWRQCCPSDDRGILSRDEPARREMRCIPFLPCRKLRFERGASRRHPFGVDPADVRPVGCGHLTDFDQTLCGSPEKVFSVSQTERESVTPSGKVSLKCPRRRGACSEM